MERDYDPEKLWTTRTLSRERFGGHISESKLEQDRYYGRGFPFIRLQKQVFYREADIQAYLAKHTIGGEASNGRDS